LSLEAKRWTKKKEPLKNVEYKKYDKSLNQRHKIPFSGLAASGFSKFLAVFGVLAASKVFLVVIIDCLIVYSILL